MSEHRRGVRANASDGEKPRRRAWIVVSIGAAVVAGLLVWQSEDASLRGPAGEAPEIPSLQVHPVPSLERAAPEWQMPEEESLPQRPRRYPLPDPETLARRPAALEREASPALIPPSPLPVEPELPKPAGAPEPLRIAQVDLPAPADAWPGRLPRHIPTEPAFAGDETSPSGREPTPEPTLSEPFDLAEPVQPIRLAGAVDLPDPAPKQSPPSPHAGDAEGFILAPAGSEPIGKFGETGPMGTNGKGLQVPLPEFTATEQGPSILVDPKPVTLDRPTLLRVPAQDQRPIQEPQATGVPVTLPNGKQPPGDFARGPNGPATPGDFARRVVPEPGTLLLVGAGLALLAHSRKRRQPGSSMAFDTRR